MEKITVRCVKQVYKFFKQGKEYQAFWDGDGYNEPSTLIAIDERGENNHHIIAEHTLDDSWFREHFVVVK